MCRPSNKSTTQRRRLSLVGKDAADKSANNQKSTLHKTHTASTASTSSSDDLSQKCPVTGRYRDISIDYSYTGRVFGSGCYGTVRKCIHRVTGQTCAVKSIKKAKIDRMDLLQREIKMLSMVNHKNIINMIDCYEDEKYIHIVTESYTGGELFDKVIDNTNSNGCMSESDAASIIKQLLEAVSYLHENDICHRDIKAENILFESKLDNSAIRLIDFGLSRTHAEGDGMMTNRAGTCYYMSPELLEGSYDKSTDMWSVGVLAYILLCGYPPFNGKEDSDIHAAIQKGDWTFGTRWAGKSFDALFFIKCLLRRDPRRRYTAKQALNHPWLRNASKTSL